MKETMKKLVKWIRSNWYFILIVILLVVWKFFPISVVDYSSATLKDANYGSFIICATIISIISIVGLFLFYFFKCMKNNAKWERKKKARDNKIRKLAAQTTPVTQTTPQNAPSVKNLEALRAPNPNVLGFSILAVGIGYTILCFVSGYFRPGFMAVGLLLLLLLGRHSVDSPGILFLRIFGIAIGMVEAGWYIILPPFMKASEHTFATFPLNIECESIHTKDKTVIEKVKVRIVARMIDPTLAMNFEGGLEQIRIEIIARVMSELVSLVGARTFGQMLVSQNECQEEISKKLNIFFNQYGYEIGILGIADFNEKVESKAREKKVEGEAEAHVIRKKAEALQDAFGNTAGNAAGNASGSAAGGQGGFSIFSAKNQQFWAYLLDELVKNFKK